MKYLVEVAGQSFEVETLTRRHVRVDGDDMVLDIVTDHVLLGTRSLRFGLLRDARGVPSTVLIDGNRIPVTVIEKRRARAAGMRRDVPRTRDVPNGGPVIAPMNGQVVKILRREGEMVDRGDVVLVLEAMKMENEVAAPLAGQVVKVFVETGVTVKPGDALFAVHPKNGPGHHATPT